LLKQQKVAVDSKLNNQLQTALIITVKNEDIILTEYLLLHNASIKIKDKAGKTALDYTHTKEMKLLLRSN